MDSFSVVWSDSEGASRANTRRLAKHQNQFGALGGVAQPKKGLGALFDKSNVTHAKKPTVAAVTVDRAIK